MKFNLKLISLYFVIAIVLVSGGIIIAGTINNDSTPIPTSYTLTDIYNLVHNNATTTEANHDLYPSFNTGMPTMYSISELYVELANLINPASTTVTYLGVTPNVTPDEVTPIIKEFDPTSEVGTVTGFTLNDIYNLITENIRPLVPDHSFAPDSGPSSDTMHTVTEIYEKLAGIIDPFILPETISMGTTYLGVSGTYALNFNHIDMATWDRKYQDGESLPAGIYYPYTEYGLGHPLAFDEDGKIYAGYYRGYIYSTDQGQSWYLADVSNVINQGTHWTDITVSPDGQLIWLSVRGDGVYVSRDGGITFDFENQLADLNSNGDLRVLQSPYYVDNLIAYLSVDVGYGQMAGKIYYSGDAGVTWNSLATAINTAGSVGPTASTPIAFDPDDVNTFYFIEMPYSDPESSILYVTHDSGATFSTVPGGITSYSSAVAISNDGNGKRLIISGACVTPIQTAISNISWAPVSGANSYCGYWSGITVHPLNQNEVFIWNKGGYSLDGGNTVQEPNMPISSPDGLQSKAYADPFSTHTFYITSLHGKLLKSIDGGENWSIVGAIPYSE